MNMQEDTKLNNLLETYNKLEELFKTSQLVMLVFNTHVTNEYRYFSRAIVDYLKTVDSEEKDKHLSRAEVALSAAYNDIIDSILNYIKSAVVDNKAQFTNINVSKILEDMDYKKVLEAMKKADEMVLRSRYKRETRLENYVAFSKTQEYKDLIEFSLHINELQIRCEIESETTPEERYNVLIDNLKFALKNNDSTIYPKFELFIQPKISMPNEELKGGEALVRFYINEETMLSPDDFLEILFSMDYHLDLSFWVLNNSVEIIKDWVDKKYIDNSFDLAINTAPSHISSEIFIQYLNKKVIQEKVSKILSIEITEDWVIEEDQHKAVHYNLAELNKDIKVSFDDFGTGTTKLEFLAKISNLKTLKIDKILVDGLLTNNRIKTKKLIKGIVKLAEANDYSVVAEGVEELQQVEILKEIEVQEIQGYYFSKPLSKNDFEEKYFKNSF